MSVMSSPSSRKMSQPNMHSCSRFPEIKCKILKLDFEKSVKAFLRAGETEIVVSVSTGYSKRNL